jgi:hypothetical protein
MQIIRHVFGASPAFDATEPLYPAINDLRHGYVGGLRYFAVHRDKSDAEWAAYIDHLLDARKPRVEGFVPAAHTAGQTNWVALDMRYDQCVGSFKCDPGRDDPDVVFSVHFSCLQGIAKPSQFASEQEFMQAVTATDDHGRYWFLRWYATFTRATRGAGLPAPKYTGPPVPGAIRAKQSPPRPVDMGSTTACTAQAATAASTALPPCFRISMAARTPDSMV